MAWKVWFCNRLFDTECYEDQSKEKNRKFYAVCFSSIAFIVKSINISVPTHIFTDGYKFSILKPAEW